MDMKASAMIGWACSIRILAQACWSAWKVSPPSPEQNMTAIWIVSTCPLFSCGLETLCSRYNCRLGSAFHREYGFPTVPRLPTRPYHPSRLVTPMILVFFFSAHHVVVQTSLAHHDSTSVWSSWFFRVLKGCISVIQDACKKIIGMKKKKQLQPHRNTKKVTHWRTYLMMAKNATGPIRLEHELSYALLLISIIHWILHQ